MYSLINIMFSTNTVNIKTVDDEVRGRDLTRDIQYTVVYCIYFLLFAAIHGE